MISAPIPRLTKTPVPKIDPRPIQIAPHGPTARLSSVEGLAKVQLHFLCVPNPFARNEQGSNKV